MTLTHNTAFDSLRGQTYMNLTTYRKNGEPVTTPVWFSLAGGVVRFATAEVAGKLKRLRANPNVLIGPATAGGTALAEPVRGVARVLSPLESEGVERVLKEKYGWQWSGLRLLQKASSRSYVYVQVKPAE